MLAPAALQGAKMGFIPGRIAQRDGDIAQPAQVANATNRRPFGHLQKPRFAPGEQLHQRRGMQRFAWAEILFIGEL
ncbi:Uncharacterised protein [Klebsiella pneumoniae]|nr:Uncharacterised protein [Klebsiella pneumoniae]